MSVFDADIAAASELIQEFGQQVTWRKFAATVDPSKPWDISSTTHTDYSPFIAFFPPSGGMASLAFLTGSDIPQGSEYGLMAGDCGFEPSLQDIIIRTDGQKAINKISKLAPNGDAVLYTVWIK